MTDEGPYTTLTVKEYTHMANVILSLREQKQKARELLEEGRAQDALDVLKEEHV